MTNEKVRGRAIVEFEYIQLLDENGVEVVKFTKDEWTAENKTLEIAMAIWLCYEHIETLKKYYNKVLTSE